MAEVKVPPPKPVRKKSSGNANAISGAHARSKSLGGGTRSSITGFSQPNVTLPKIGGVDPMNGTAIEQKAQTTSTLPPSSAPSRPAPPTNANRVGAVGIEVASESSSLPSRRSGSFIGSRSPNSKRMSKKIADKELAKEKGKESKMKEKEEKKGEKEEKKEKEKKKKEKKDKKNKSSTPELNISAPTECKHVSHVGPDMTNLPSEWLSVLGSHGVQQDQAPKWNKLVELSGISHDQLKDKRTSMFVADVLGFYEQEGSVNSVAAMNKNKAPRSAPPRRGPTTTGTPSRMAQSTIRSVTPPAPPSEPVEPPPPLNDSSSSSTTPPPPPSSSSSSSSSSTTHTEPTSKQSKQSKTKSSSSSSSASSGAPPPPPPPPPPPSLTAPTSKPKSHKVSATTSTNPTNEPKVARTATAPGGGNAANLLDEIRGAGLRSLKSVPAEEKERKKKEDQDNMDDDDIAAALKRAMAILAKATQGDSDDDSEISDDDWD